MKVLVTGASGFIGRNVLLGLHEAWDITAVYHTRADFPDWLRGYGLGRVRPVCCDLTDAARVQADLAGGFDGVVHLAANGDPAWSVEHPVEDLRAATVSTLNLLRHVAFGRFVYFSSGAVYDGLKGVVGPHASVSPRLPYAVSRLASERYVARYAPEGAFVIARFFGAYGPFEPERKIYSRLVRRFGLEGGSDFTLRGDGRNLIDAMYVADAVEIIRRLAERPVQQPVVDVGCGQPLTVRRLVEEAAACLGCTAPRIQAEGVVPEYIEFRMDAGPLRAIYDFKPGVTLREGLLRLKEHLLQEGE